MKKYIKIMRIDHWIKQLFITPGIICAYLLSDHSFDSYWKIIVGLLSTCFIASANYVINEYLDAEFDKFHPTKKHRSVVEEGVNGKIVFLLWDILTCVGAVLGYFVNLPFMFMALFLWFMGILYNVKPIRTKDIPFLDVLSESINNAIRFMLGWFIISDNTIAPSSILFGYWMGGAFLMATKRYAEYRMINDPELAGKYRKSFKLYTEHSLLLSAFFYAMCSVFFIGVFLVKYRIELLLWIPLLIGLFCYYFYISFKEDSAVQKPEKLYHEKGLMLYCCILILVFVALMFIDIPWLSTFTTTSIIQF
jgi:4-hydroxybenzoate polyprenyltransferase